MTDAWSGLADLLANLIEKYAGDLNLDSFPNPIKPEDAFCDKESSTELLLNPLDLQK